MDLLIWILGTLLAFAFGARITWIVISALRSGAATIGGGKQFSRRKRPLAYWTIVGIQAGFAAMFLLVGMLRLTRP